MKNQLSLTYERHSKVKCVHLKPTVCASPTEWLGNWGVCLSIHTWFLPQFQAVSDCLEPISHSCPSVPDGSNLGTWPVSIESYLGCPMWALLISSSLFHPIAKGLLTQAVCKN